MNLDKVEINIVDGIDEKTGEVIESTQTFYYTFNYNSIRAFKKAENVSNKEFADIFGELTKDEKDQDMDIIAMANEYFGQMLYYALVEGERIIRRKFPLSIDDIQLFINDPDNTIKAGEVGVAYAESLFRPLLDSVDDKDSKKGNKDKKKVSPLLGTK